MINYEEYIHNQTVVHGQVKKPYHYRVGQRRALDHFFSKLQRGLSVLDIGCGEGTGLKHLRKIGYTDLTGIDLHPKKVELCRRRNLNVVCGDFLTYDFSKSFDFIWMSHSLEHMLYPEKVIQKIIKITYVWAAIFIIVPYPDTGPVSGHPASSIMGTRVNDEGKTFLNWIKRNGLFITQYKFDDFREKEIWVMCQRL